MTVQELIDALQKIEDKSLEVQTIRTDDVYGDYYCDVSYVSLETHDMLPIFGERKQFERPIIAIG